MYKHLHQVKRLLIIIAGIIILYFILKYVILFFYPFLLAILLAFFINPIVTYLEIKIKLPRLLATIIIISIGIIIMASILLFIFTEFIQGTAFLAEKIPIYFQDFIVTIEHFINHKIVPIYHNVLSFIKTLDQTKQITINEYIHQFTTQIATTGTKIIRDILLTIPIILSVLPQSITMFVLIVLSTILITNDWHALKKTIKGIFPLSLSQQGKNIVSHLRKSFLGFIQAQLILVSITACIIIIGLLFLKVDHALTIALLIAIVDLLPLIGAGIVFVPWIIYLFLSANYSLTISLSVLYMIIVITRQIIEPKIISASIGLKPLTALFTLFISIQIWGVLTGIIVSPILLVIASSFHRAGIIDQLLRYVKG